MAVSPQSIWGRTKKIGMFNRRRVFKSKHTTINSKRMKEESRSHSRLAVTEENNYGYVLLREYDVITRLVDGTVSCHHRLRKMHYDCETVD
jgi:hypothetical protein